jgi:SAM-dependent methyltransferase
MVFLMEDHALRIYWANSLFNKADRNFNAYCAKKLRDAGYTVYLPQEAEVNVQVEPAAEDIFVCDTAQILQSSLLIACLDQETIDSGVACEIGLAYAFGIPILGLYTDIRQNRTGRGRMYKNLYVLGAVERLGAIARNLDELVRMIPEHLNANGTKSQMLAQHFDDISPRYAQFVKRLESWYSPPWTVILEVGCGPGELGAYLYEKNQISYLGFDVSERMVAIANNQFSKESCRYTADPQIVLEFAKMNPIDLVVSSFMMHDQPNMEQTIEQMKRYVRSEGHILLIDLSVHDLSRIVDILKRNLGAPAVCSDSRIEPSLLVSAVSRLDLDLEKFELVMLTVTFPSATDVDEYFELFGIYKGMDLPLGLRSRDYSKNKRIIGDTLKSLTYPLEDRRAFAVCLLRRK